MPSSTGNSSSASHSSVQAALPPTTTVGRRNSPAGLHERQVRPSESISRHAASTTECRTSPGSRMTAMRAADLAERALRVDPSRQLLLATAPAARSAAGWRSRRPRGRRARAERDLGLVEVVDP